MADALNVKVGRELDISDFGPSTATKEDRGSLTGRTISGGPAKAKNLTTTRRPVHCPHRQLSAYETEEPRFIRPFSR